MCTFKKLLFTAILATLAGCTTTVDQYGSHSDTLTFSGRQRMVYADPGKPVDPSHISQDIARNDPMMGVVSEALKVQDPAARDAVLRTVENVAPYRNGGFSAGGNPYSGATRASSMTINQFQNSLIVNKTGYTWRVELIGPTNLSAEVPAKGWYKMTILPGSYTVRVYDSSGVIHSETLEVVNEVRNDAWSFVGTSHDRMDADFIYIVR